MDVSFFMQMNSEQNRYHKTFPHDKRIMKGTMGHENTFYRNVTVMWEELRVKPISKISVLYFRRFIAIWNKVRRRNRSSKEEAK